MILYAFNGNRSLTKFEYVPLLCILSYFTSHNTFNSTAERADTDCSEFRAKVIGFIPNVSVSIERSALSIQHFIPFFLIVGYEKKVVTFAEF